MRHIVLAAALAIAAPLAAIAQTPPQQPPVQQPPQGQRPPGLPDVLGLKVEREPQAMAIFKAMSDRLAAAKTMQFDMTALYESPARTGAPLAYLTESHVALERPNKLRVITPGDGPPQEFYYDGTRIMAYSPQDDMVAVADAPPVIEGALALAFDRAAVYFPFSDIVFPDVYKELADGVKVAFVVGKSHAVGGVETDIITLVNEDAQGQIWIGTEDKLPRMLRVTYFNEPGQFRHEAVFSNWKLDAPLPADSFWSAKAEAGKKIEFAAPQPAPAAQGKKP